MKNVVPVLLILLISQATSGARVLLGGEENGTGGSSTPPLTAKASGQASGTTGARVSVGAAIDGTTRTGVAGGLAEAAGTNAATKTEAEVETPTSKGTAATQIAGGGTSGGQTTSTVQVIGTPDAVSTIGFSNGKFNGLGSFLQGTTRTSAQTRFGTSTGRHPATAVASWDAHLAAVALPSCPSAVHATDRGAPNTHAGESLLDGADNRSVEGSTGSQSLSGFNNLLSDSRSILKGGSGGSVASIGTSRVTGGNTIATRAASRAATFLRPTSVSGTVDASVTGPGNAQVDGTVTTTQP